MILTLAISLVTIGQNLGTYGEVFEIEEEDCLKMIYSRLEKNKNKKLDISQVKMFKAVEGISETKTPREFIYDPSITLSRNIQNTEGVVFAKKGQKINPLDMVSLSKPIVFIDGTDEKQIVYLYNKIKSSRDIKVIVVKGSPFKVSNVLRWWNIYTIGMIYFDQKGFITKKLGIKHVPAVVFQKPGEKVLTVVEEVCE